jgi:hypothetical protein
MDITKSNTLLMETVETNDAQVCIRCYLAEHVRMLQTMLFYMFGVGPRQRAPGSSSDGSRVSVCVPNGTRVNLLTNLSRACDYGENLSGWSRVRVEGVTFIYSFQKQELCIKVKYYSPLIEDAKLEGYIPSTALGHTCLPRPGQYFVYKGVSMRVLEYNDGAFVQCARSSLPQTIKHAHIELVDVETLVSARHRRRL